MAKNKERSEVEFLRAENKKMKSLVRNLKKQINRQGKREHLYTDLEEREAEAFLEEEKKAEELFQAKNKCPDCVTGDLELFELGVKKLHICQSCNYRKLKK